MVGAGEGSSRPGWAVRVVGQRGPQQAHGVVIEHPRGGENGHVVLAVSVDPAGDRDPLPQGGGARGLVARFVVGLAVVAGADGRYQLREQRVYALLGDFPRIVRPSIEELPG